MALDTETHELEELRAPDEQQPIDQTTEIDALPPTDHGRGAYTALACCTIAQAPIWGRSHLARPSMRGTLV
jgi:hypothetical protein